MYLLFDFRTRTLYQCQNQKILHLMFLYTIIIRLHATAAQQHLKHGLRASRKFKQHAPQIVIKRLRWLRSRTLHWIAVHCYSFGVLLPSGFFFFIIYIAAPAIIVATEQFFQSNLPVSRIKYFTYIGNICTATMEFWYLLNCLFFTSQKSTYWFLWEP